MKNRLNRLDEYPSQCRRGNHEEVIPACQIESGYGLSRGFQEPGGSLIIE